MQRRGYLKAAKWGCGCLALVFLGIAIGLFVLLNRVPKTYPSAANPIPPPTTNFSPGGGLDGFDSPYLGHTGSWDGKGGALAGGKKTKDLDAESGMGLRWTFMPVYWRALEPDAPVDLAQAIPPAWEALDNFMIAAHDHKLNVLMQAPVIGGNAGGPPAWAGRREKGKSAPTNMDAAAAFAGKLARRYAPGGTIASRQGWNDRYGVRAWELDNEPNSYLTHWNNQAADYAEFVTRTADAIRKVDPQAVIIGPGANLGGKSLAWIESTLDAQSMRGSPEFRRIGRPFSIGPALDVVSFHVYEGLDSALTGKDRTIEVVFSEIRETFDRWQNRAPGFTYKQKEEYWHTEGNFDFLGILSRERRAAWRIQFLTRAFAAGVRKVMIMDASGPEQIAVRTYIRALPNPFPMIRATERLTVLSGHPVAFCHLDGSNAAAGQVWILWAPAGSSEAEVNLPVIHPKVLLLEMNGTETAVTVTNNRVKIQLRADNKMSPPVLLIDRDEPAHP